MQVHGRRRSGGGGDRGRKRDQGKSTMEKFDQVYVKIRSVSPRVRSRAQGGLRKGVSGDIRE